jgi:hypothetical protein
MSPPPINAADLFVNNGMRQKLLKILRQREINSLKDSACREYYHFNQNQILMPLMLV